MSEWIINCPTCNESLVFPNGLEPYCEECGWPDSDFNGEYYYPKIGEELNKYQPGLQFYSEEGKEWVESGVKRGQMRASFRGLYRTKL
jgi:hypothetical protein